MSRAAEGAGEPGRPQAHTNEEAGTPPTRWDFLAEASRHLAESLDYETTLRNVAEISLPLLGSWSIVDLSESDGSVRRLAVVHPDPEMQDVARQLKEGWPPQREDPLGIPAVTRTGETSLLEEVTDQLLVHVARGTQNLERLRTLGIGSVMTVPVEARGNILGAITFVSGDDHRYTPDDISLAEDLADRCAFAIDNARLHREAASTTEAQRAQLRAEAASQVRKEFLNTASHELRTPLNAITGYVELLAMEVAGPLTARQRDYVKAIGHGGQQLLTLVENMLNFVRLSSDVVRYNRRSFFVHRTVRNVTNAYGPVLEDAGLTLEVSCPSDLQGYADPPKVWQILLNLLSNSRKFTDRGGTIEVEVEMEADGGRVLIHVHDTGSGISEDKLETIFEPLMTGDTSLTRKTDGMGLGLAIGRELARGMDGDLTVESPAGGGCTFTLALPASQG